MVTFSRGGIDYLRVALFGGQGASWMESGNECRGYLRLHMADWGSQSGSEVDSRSCLKFYRRPRLFSKTVIESVS